MMKKLFEYHIYYFEIKKFQKQQISEMNFLITKFFVIIVFQNITKLN